MCAPCKVVINGSFTQAAERANTIRTFLQASADGNLPPVKEDDELYALALAEVKAIDAVRAAGVAMAERVGAPPRWKALMERL